jgi:hypothetical protein
MTSLGLAQYGPGGVFVYLTMTRDYQLALTSHPHVVLSTMPGKAPTEIVKPLLKIPTFLCATLHQCVYMSSRILPNFTSAERPASAAKSAGAPRALHGA